MRMFRHFPKRRDIPGILFVLLVVAGLLFLNLKYPDRKAATNFGPEWQCSGSGRSPDFCMKKPAADPANKQRRQIKT